jgi:hypothetical protein
LHTLRKMNYRHCSSFKFTSALNCILSFWLLVFEFLFGVSENFLCSMPSLLLKIALMLYTLSAPDKVTDDREIYIIRNVMKSSVFWDVTMCNPSKVNLYFGRTCRLHFQRQRISQIRNSHEAGLDIETVSSASKFIGDPKNSNALEIV